MQFRHLKFDGIVEIFSGYFDTPTLLLPEPTPSIVHISVAKGETPYTVSRMAVSLRPHKSHAEKVKKLPVSMFILEINCTAFGTTAYFTSFETVPYLRSQGIGTFMLDVAVQLAQELGAPTLELHVMKDNPRAQALYERYGFVVTDNPNRRFANVAETMLLDVPTQYAAIIARRGQS